MISRFKKTGIYPFYRYKVLLSIGNSDNSQSSEEGKYIQALCYIIMYWHHFAGGKGDGNAIGQSIHTADGSSDQCSNSKAT